MSFRWTFTVAILLSFGFSTARADQSVTLLAQLQTVMQRHIEGQLIDGALRVRDLSSGDISLYYPTERHSMVMSIDEDYILCTDLVSESGESVPVDFYVTSAGDDYFVYQTEINNRRPLKALMNKNLVERLR
ncbi:hypothetical protein N9Y00_07850 [Tateyamaria sp.]|jgi:hypothetical protein|nr:hypothetical protein [Tateyamaria sp.]